MTATSIGLRRLALTLLTLASMLCGAGAQESTPERLVIGLDLSESNPLVVDAEYALKLAERVGDRIETLALKSEVLIRTFGAVDSTLNTLQVNEVVSIRNRPEAIAQSAKLLIANVPKLVAEGRMAVQAETNILAFIETMVTAIGECETKTTFILLTDGLEDSAYARLADPASRLPLIDIKPPEDRRRTCDELQILGLGEGLDDPAAFDRLHAEWRAWATGRNRPFKRFVGLRDW